MALETYNNGDKESKEKYHLFPYPPCPRWLFHHFATNQSTTTKRKKTTRLATIIETILTSISTLFPFPTHMQKPPPYPLPWYGASCTTYLMVHARHKLMAN
jgi:hypothetical protein